MSVLANGTAIKARILFAHGAGAPMDSPFMNEVAEQLADEQIEVVRFEFPYMAQRRQNGKKRPPERIEKLMEHFLDRVDDYSGSVPLYLMGKSMGGRVASMIVEKTAALGVFALGYPFHPIGKPEKLRVEHLEGLTKPVMIFQGTRDPMGTIEEVVDYTLSEWVDVYWLEDANHDLKPRVKSGFTQEQYITEVVTRIREKISLTSDEG